MTKMTKTVSPEREALAAAIAIWYVPAYLVDGQLFVRKFLIEQNLQRFAGGDAAHNSGLIGMPMYCHTETIEIAVSALSSSPSHGANQSARPPMAAASQKALSQAQGPEAPITRLRPRPAKDSSRQPRATSFMRRRAVARGSDGDSGISA